MSLAFRSERIHGFGGANHNLGFQMFSHPSAIIGYILAAIGWFLLATGGASDVGYGARGIINFHTLWIASGLILSGGMLIVAGVVAGGMQRIAIYLSGNAEMKAAFDAYEAAQRAPAATPDPAQPVDEETLRRKLVERSFRP
jgi:hypothetical protein